MKVEPFGYPLDDRLLTKIDLMIQRCVQVNPKRDAVLLFEGPEGEGKTTFSIAVAYYIKMKTGRDFSQQNVFFDVRKMIQFLQNTEGQIAIWDEPALQAMSKDSLTTLVKDLERLLLMSRKKRHFVMINIAYFNKFSEYIVWQRPLGMIHLYSRDEITPGRYVYIRKKSLEPLWYDWRSKRKRNYKKYCSKSIRGTFPDVLNPKYKHNVLSAFDDAAYESEKDKAIQMIGQSKEKMSRDRKELIKLRLKLANNPERKKIAELIGVSTNVLYQWSKRLGIDSENEGFAKEIGVMTLNGEQL